MHFLRKFKHCIKEIGFDPGSFSTHGFRREGATLAFQAKIPSD